jgi:hypothetical protein
LCQQIEGSIPVDHPKEPLQMIAEFKNFGENLSIDFERHVTLGGGMLETFGHPPGKPSGLIGYQNFEMHYEPELREDNLSRTDKMGNRLLNRRERRLLLLNFSAQYYRLDGCLQLRLGKIYFRYESWVRKYPSLMTPELLSLIENTYALSCSISKALPFGLKPWARRLHLGKVSVIWEFAHINGIKIHGKPEDQKQAELLQRQLDMNSEYVFSCEDA